MSQESSPCPGCGKIGTARSRSYASLECHNAACPVIQFYGERDAE